MNAISELRDLQEKMSSVWFLIEQHERMGSRPEKIAALWRKFENLEKVESELLRQVRRRL